MSKHTALLANAPQTDLNASHKAIIAYLNVAKLPASAAALRQEVDLRDSFDDATSKKYEGLLERKWTSVVRLQKKVTMPTGSEEIGAYVHRN